MRLINSLKPSADWSITNAEIIWTEGFSHWLGWTEIDESVDQFDSWAFVKFYIY